MSDTSTPDDEGIMQPASPDAAEHEAPADVAADVSADAGTGSSSSPPGEGGRELTEAERARLAAVLDALERLGGRVAEVEAVLTPEDEDVAPLAVRIDDGLTLISELVDAVEQITETVESVGARIEKIEKTVAERERKKREHQRVYRFELYEEKTPQAVAKACGVIAKQMELLGEWVAWFVRTYRLWSVIPPCWAAHPLLFEELAGLRVAWAGAWTDPEARHDAVVVFNEQAWRFRERMGSEQWGSPTCTAAAHGENQSYVEWAESDAGVKAFELALEEAQKALVGRGAGE